MKISTEAHLYNANSAHKTRSQLQSVSMTWEGLLSRLTNRGKVETAAITNLEGEVLASTADWHISTTETVGVLKAVCSNYGSLIKMKISDDLYTCFRHDNCDTIVGKAEDKVLVAHKCQQCMIIGFADVESPGSCIYDITEFGKHIEKRGL
ncbi:hypothetical protein SNE40_004328 [Patella caerulea]|uniref:Profilin n=1 Tax=Patella caerulea TaxID=87958 RepID=A0AAN8PX24_PATCE